MSLKDQEEFYRKLEKLELLKQREKLRSDLPHKYGFNLYSWQKEFIESDNRNNILKAGNQLGKSIAQGLKWVTLATEPDLWPKYFPRRVPKTFWMLMPTRDVINTEFLDKYEPEFMPGPIYKDSDHPQYGWRFEIKNRNIWAIHFNTGVTVYTHTYSQEVHHLQSGTVDLVAVDEELPYYLYPELNMRRQAVNGIFNMVYTPTRGEVEWMRLWNEGRTETFKTAYKKQVSLFDCQTFANGEKSHWTEEAINRVLNSLGTESEIQLRVFGKNSKIEGLKIPAFTPEHNLVETHRRGKTYPVFCGIDIGSGGPKNHPAAICFVAIRPDYKHGRVLRAWRGDSTKVTGASEICDQYFKMKDELKIEGHPEAVYYDWAAKDFELTAIQRGIPLLRAEKSHEVGYPLLNTLFKNQMLVINDTEENQGLVEELLSLRTTTAKSVAKDDSIDSLRYAVSKIPWDLTGIDGSLIKRNTEDYDPDKERQKRRYHFAEDFKEWGVDEEIEQWNDLYDPQ